MDRDPTRREITTATPSNAFLLHVSEGDSSSLIPLGKDSGVSIVESSFTPSQPCHYSSKRCHWTSENNPGRRFRPSSIRAPRLWERCSLGYPTVSAVLYSIHGPACSACKYIADHLVYSPLLFGFANLEELRISMWAVGGPPPQIVHPLLRSVASPHLRRVIVDVEVYGKATGRIQWPLLDETLVNLVERHRAYGNLALQISTTVNPEKIRALLPRAAEEGGLEVRFSKRPDDWT